MKVSPPETEPVPGAHPDYRATPKWQSRTFLLSVASRLGFVVTAVFALIAYEAGKRDPGLPVLVLAIGTSISGFLNSLGVAAAREVAVEAGAQASLLSAPPPMVAPLVSPPGKTEGSL